jgi:uridine kinase
MIDTLRSIVMDLLAVRGTPVTVMLDGPSGAGKSTVAHALANLLPATLVPSDDFFAAQLTRAEWDARSPMERARDAIDWDHLRRCALEPLRAGECAEWHPFDFAAGERADGSYGLAARVEERKPAPVIIVDGAYSSRPELADLMDLAVLIDAPSTVRRERLGAREDPLFLSAWHARWDPAETYYFQQVRPPHVFDVVVDTMSGAVRDLRQHSSRAQLLPNER